MSVSMSGRDQREYNWSKARQRQGKEKGVYAYLLDIGPLLRGALGRGGGVGHGGGG
jgi:hypothetical protein